MKRKAFTFGSHGQPYVSKAVANGYIDEALLADTAGKVKDYEDEHGKIQAMPLRPEPGDIPPPSHIPDRHKVVDDGDGVAGDSTLSHALILAREDDWITKYRRLALVDAQVIFAIVSHASGTGNGGHPVLRKISRQEGGAGGSRELYLHDFEPSVRRKHMAKGLLQLLFEDQRYDAERTLVDVLARGNLDEMLRTPAAILDRIMPIVTNDETEKESYTDFSAIQYRHKQYDHEEKQEELQRLIVEQKVPQRLKDGDPELTDHQREERRQTIESLLDRIWEVAFPDSDNMAVALQGVETSVLQAKTGRRDRALANQADEVAAKVVAEDAPLIRRAVTDIFEQASEVGYGTVIPMIEEFVTDLEERYVELRGQASIEEALQTFLEALPTWTRLKSVFGLSPSLSLNGQAKPLKDYITREIAKKMVQGTLSALRELQEVLEQKSAVKASEEIGVSPDVERLPEELLKKLVEIYLWAVDAGNDPTNALEEAISQRLATIIDELIRADYKAERYEFPFPIAESADKYRGLVAESPFAESLRALRLFHTSPDRMDIQVTSGEVTRIAHCVSINELSQVPQLLQMLRDVEREAEKSDDRRPYMWDAKSTYPSAYFERPGELNESDGALLLAKAYLANNVLIAYEDRIELRVDGDVGVYSTFRDFLNELRPRWVWWIHRAFWNRTFASDRSSTIRALERLVAGEPRKGNQQQRYNRLRRFVGKQRFDRALGELLHRLNVAKGYWKS